MTSPFSRRRALSGAATVGLGLPLLAACGDDGADTAADPTDTASSPASSPTNSPASSAATESPEEGASGSADAPVEGLVSTSDVEVGGGVILGDDAIVVTQPSEGEFKAFSATCTHQSCLVGSVEDSVIVCPCHGSSFSAEDGSVLTGPAPSPLGEIAVEVVGDQVVRS